MISPVPSYDNIFLSDPGPIYTWPFPTIYLPNLVSYKTCFPQPFLNFSSTLVFNFFFSHFLKKAIMSQRSNSIGPFLAMFIVGTLNTSLSMNWPNKFLSYQRLECAWWDQSTLDPISTCMCDVTRQIFFFICLCLCLCLCRVLLTQFLLLCVGVTRRIGRGVLTQITQSGPVTCFERRKLSQKDEKSKKKAFGEYLHWQTIKRTVNTFFLKLSQIHWPIPLPPHSWSIRNFVGVFVGHLPLTFCQTYSVQVVPLWYFLLGHNRGENCKNLINHTFFQKNISNFWKEKI